MACESSYLALPQFNKVLPPDAWLRLQFVFPTIINIAKILSAHEDARANSARKRRSQFGCNPSHNGGQIVNAIDHLADWCYNVLSMKRVKRFLLEYETQQYMRSSNSDGNTNRSTSSRSKEAQATATGSLTSGTNDTSAPVQPLASYNSTESFTTIMSERDDSSAKGSPRNQSASSKVPAAYNVSTGGGARNNTRSRSNIQLITASGAGAHVPNNGGSSVSYRQDSKTSSLYTAKTGGTVQEKHSKHNQRSRQDVEAPLFVDSSDDDDDYYPPEGAEDEMSVSDESDLFVDAEEGEQVQEQGLEDLNDIKLNIARTEKINSDITKYCDSMSALEAKDAMRLKGMGRTTASGISPKLKSTISRIRFLIAKVL